MLDLIVEELSRPLPSNARRSDAIGVGGAATPPPELRHLHPRLLLSAAPEASGSRGLRGRRATENGLQPPSVAAETQAQAQAPLAGAAFEAECQPQAQAARQSAQTGEWLSEVLRDEQKEK